MKNKSLKITILLSSVFFVFVAQPLKAQTEFGVKGGVLFSGINKKYRGSVFDFEERTGFAAGIFLRKLNLVGPIGLQAELLYQLKGGDYFIRYFGDGTYGSYGGYYSGYGYPDERTVPWLRRTEKYHYLSLPFLLTFSPMKFMDVYAGPETGWLIATSEYSAFRDDLSQFSAGLAAGIILKISKNTKFDLRYSEDLTPLYDFGDSNLKNYSFTLSLQKTLFRSNK